MRAYSNYFDRADVPLAAKKARTETAPLVRRVQAAPPKRADQSLFGAARADPLARFLGPAVASAASRPAPSANAAPMPAATSTTRPSSADSQTGATPPRQLDRSGKVKKTVRWRDANLVEIRAIEARDDMSNAPRHSGDFEREGEMLKHRLAEQTWYEPDGESETASLQRAHALTTFVFSPATAI